MDSVIYLSQIIIIVSMGFILLLVALIGIVLTVVLIPFTFVWKWITFGLKNALSYLGDIAISIDQTGNVYLKEALNRWTIRRGVEQYFYGDDDDTISYVVAMNFYKGNLNKFGLMIARMLEKAENNHLRKAIHSKIKRDFESLDRLEKSGVVEGSEVTEVNGLHNYIKKVDNKKI